MQWKDFWYIVAESQELRSGQALSRSLFGEWVVLFRESSGRVVAQRDRCLHRSAQLSKGRVQNGHLVCPYHGWTYDAQGQVVHVPSEGPGEPSRRRCNVAYEAIEKDDYIYVRLNRESKIAEPFSMPCYRRKGYTTIRLQNLFSNTVINCAENFVDIPHTTFVHPRIFRDPRHEKFGALVEREKGSVKVTYQGERKNFGLFSWFLNPSGQEIQHTDEYHMPNVTTVNYWFGGQKHFIITSQTVPVDDKTSLVYTDLTYNYGVWTWLSRPFVRRQAQMIIDQDIEILENQMKTIEKYGQSFQNSSADVIHTFIESIQTELDEGRDPRELPRKETRIEFWV